MTNLSIREKLNNVIKQFLCNVTFNTFNWHNIFTDILPNEDLQKTLLQQTVNSNLVIEYPIQLNYQKSFVKHLIDNLERLQLQRSTEQDTVICDELYSTYGRLVALDASSQSCCYKHYCLGKGTKVDKVISLQESSNLISDGTTGLRTWQAALALSEWLLENKHEFENKSVLELGSGIGLAGLVLAKVCSPKTTYLTDCHGIVLKTLCDNVKLNLSPNPEDTNSTEKCGNADNHCQIQQRCLYSSSLPQNVFVLNLPWEEVNREECQKLGDLDKIIAADIIYDDELFESLINAMKCFAEFCGAKEFIFSCTVRNPSTLGSFIKDMNFASFRTIELEVPDQKVFLWPTDTPVRIFRFIKS